MKERERERGKKGQRWAVRGCNYTDRDGTEQKGRDIPVDPRVPFFCLPFRFFFFFVDFFFVHFHVERRRRRRPPEVLLATRYGRRGKESRNQRRFFATKHKPFLPTKKEKKRKEKETVSNAPFPVSAGYRCGRWFLFCFYFSIGSNWFNFFLCSPPPFPFHCLPFPSPGRRRPRPPPFFFVVRSFFFNFFPRIFVRHRSKDSPHFDCGCFFLFRSRSSSSTSNQVSLIRWIINSIQVLDFIHHLYCINNTFNGSRVYSNNHKKNTYSVRLVRYESGKKTKKWKWFKKKRQLIVPC